MERNGSGVSALLGLDGFVVRAQLLDEASGEWCLAIETTEDRGWCPTCGVRAVGHGRRRVKVRDLPLADRPVVLVWAKRLWRCPERACPMGSWSEETTRSLLERCSPSGPERRSPAGWASVSSPSPEQPAASEWAGTQRWPPCGITANPASTTWPVSARPWRSGWIDLAPGCHRHPSDPAGDGVTRERRVGCAVDAAVDWPDAGHVSGARSGRESCRDRRVV